MTERLTRVRLKDRVAERLLEMISSGDLRPGHRLPPERILVERWGVSRTVVREALNLLETRGLIRIEHGRGAVVAADTANAVQENFRFFFRTRPDAIWELMEVRKPLEVEIAGLAAERADAQELAAMKAVLDRMRKMIDAPEGYVDADVSFHSLLAKSTHNHVLMTMMEPITNLLLDSRRQTGAVPENARRALKAHEKILGRVEARNVEGARREMRAHLVATEHDLKAVLGKQRGG
jgi:GntR family transcriptional repressor for pyruvate dehydrogenase complex